MRRKDRERNETFAYMVLDKCSFAVLATSNEDGTPYCIPVNIVRKEDTLYFHCALTGQKTDNLRRNPRVCITAVGDVRIPEDQFTTKYESAVAVGEARELTQEEEKVEALRLLCRHHVPTHMDAFDEEIRRELARTGVWEIKMLSVTGKCRE